MTIQPPSHDWSPLSVDLGLVGWELVREVEGVWMPDGRACFIFDTPGLTITPPNEKLVVKAAEDPPMARLYRRKKP